MSKFQPDYNKAQKKTIQVMIPNIDKEIRELQQTKNTMSDPNVKKGIDARIKALQIKKKSYKAGDPIEEEKELRGLEAIESSLAKEYGISIDKVKEYSDKIKEELDKKKTPKDDKYYEYVVGTLKKILNNRKKNEEGEVAVGDGITTTSIGNAAEFGGSANYAPKVSMVSRTKTYKVEDPVNTQKKKIKKPVYEYIDNLLN